MLAFTERAGTSNQIRQLLVRVIGPRDFSTVARSDAFGETLFAKGFQHPGDIVPPRPSSANPMRTGR